MRKLLIKTRSLVLMTAFIIFWSIIGFIIASQVRRISRLENYRAEILAIQGKISDIKLAGYSVIFSERRSIAFYEEGRSNGLAAFNQLSLDIYNQIDNFENDLYFQERELLMQKLSNISSYLVSVQTQLERCVALNRRIGWESYGLYGLWLEQLQQINDPLLTGSTFYSLSLDFMAHPGQEAADRLLRMYRSYLPLETSNQAEPGTENGEPPEMQNQIKQHYQTFLELTSLMEELGYTQYDGYKGSMNRELDIISEETRALVELFDLEATQSINRSALAIGLLIVLFLLLFSLLLYFFSKSIHQPLSVLKNHLKQLVKGKFPVPLQPAGDDEVTEMINLLNDFSASLKDKTEFASTIKETMTSTALTPLSKEDQLANALLDLGEYLKAAETEDHKRQEAAEKRRWTNEGIARFSDILRTHSSHLENLADDLTKNLVRYLDASLAGMFLTDQDDPKKLSLIASFAYETKKYIHSSFRYGEGLVGTCAIEKKSIFLTDIPDDYIKVTSGIGESNPRNLLLVPLKLEEELLGVIEIASMNEFAPHEIEFVEKIADSIASTIAAVKMNIRTAMLLEQSQKHAREMAEQEEKTQQSMKKLQEAQEESARRESEITGILNAIEHSALVAEYDLDERMTTINDKFLILMETQRDHIIGKRLSEVTGISRHTDAYKELWAKLNEGETVSKVEKIRLVNGKEIWLRQTYTPIPDKEGKPFTILKIATDITETIRQQESLERQASEISRANIEMKSFSQAVDQALIKCVYSPTGQILETNENFEQVTGFTSRELTGKNNRVFLQKQEKDQFDKIWEDIVKDKPYSGVIRRTRPTGEEVWIMSSFTPVKDESGTIYKVYYLGLDITERKLKYQLLEDANREIDRLRSQMNESLNE